MPTYEEWLEKQPEEVKQMINEHYSGLLNAVKATREERDALSVELKKIAKGVDAESETGKQLGDLRKRLAESERKASFMENATKAGVKRPSVAYLLATSNNLFLEDGSPDFEKIRQEVPELFTVQSIGSNAGSGTNSTPIVDANKAVRQELQGGTVTVKTRR